MPTKWPQSKNKTFTLRLDDEDLKMLQEIAKAEKDKMINCVRRMIRRKHKAVFFPYHPNKITMTIPGGS